MPLPMTNDIMFATFYNMSVYVLFQPGQYSERVVDEGNGSSAATGLIETNLVIRFPIPNERELRKHRSSIASGFSKTINFTGDGSQVTRATDLPYKAPGLL